MANEENKKNNYYYVDEIEVMKLRSKMIIFYIMVTGVFGVWFIPNISNIIKVVFTVAFIYILVINYYRVKNLFGLRKNPFKLNTETGILTYYNEFRGNIDVDVNKIRSIKGYLNNGKAYLLEVFVKGSIKEENINVEAMSAETVAALMKDIKEINTKIEVSSNGTQKKNK